MANNSVTLFKDKTLKSEIQEGSAMFAVHGKTCMFIKLPTKSIADELQKWPTEGNVMIAKLREIISKLSTNPRHGNSKSRVGLIYFKKEYNLITPMLYLSEEFCDFMRDNFPKAVVNLSGTIRLDGKSSDSSACSYLESTRFQKSFGIQYHVRSLVLTNKSYPLDMILPIKDCQWTLQKFTLSIEWKDEQWLGEIATPTPNRFVQTLFKAEEGCPPKDFILVAGNEAEIPCHGMVLGAQSPVLTAMINPIMATKEKESKRIEMKMFSEDALNAFVLYIYCQPVPLAKMDCDTALELFRLGHMYQLQDLAKMVGKMMLQKGEEWFSPNVVLELYFLVKNLSEFKPLANHAADVMLKFLDAVRRSERYQELDKEEALELVWILLNQATNGQALQK